MTKVAKSTSIHTAMWPNIRSGDHADDVAINGTARDIVLQEIYETMLQ
jgi:hypothetical protein